MKVLTSATPTALILLFMFLWGCNGRPAQLSAYSRPGDVTNKVLAKRKVKVMEMDDNGSRKPAAQVARGNPF